MPPPTVASRGRGRLTPNDDPQDVDCETRNRALDQIRRAQIFLLQRNGWYGDMSMRMHWVVTRRVPTACIRVDWGCFVNPDFFAELDIAERAFVIAHELEHVARLHFDRQKGRDAQLWNSAADYAINAALIAADLKAPFRTIPGLLHDAALAELSEEQIYAKLVGHPPPTQSRPPTSPSATTADSAAVGNADAGTSSGAPPSTPAAATHPDEEHRAGSESAAADYASEGREQHGAPLSPSSEKTHGDNREDGRCDSGSTHAAAHKGGAPSTRPASAGGEVAPDSDVRVPDGAGDVSASVDARHLSADGVGTAADCDFAATDELRRRSADGTGRHVPTPIEVNGAMRAAAQRNRANGRGNLPGHVERLIEELSGPEESLADILDNYLSVRLGEGSTYRRPSRRSAGLQNVPGLPAGVGLLLPGRREDYDTIVAVLDSSGSRSDVELSRDRAMLVELIEKYGRPLRIISADAQVQTDQDVSDVSEIVIKGGGGTRSEPVFEQIESDNAQTGTRTRLVIYFTDLQITFPDVPPDVEVLWVFDGAGEAPPVPFGDVISRPQRAVRVSNYLRDQPPVVTSAQTRVPRPATSQALARPR